MGWGFVIHGEIKEVRRRVKDFLPDGNGRDPGHVALMKEVIYRELARLPARATQVHICAGGDIGNDRVLHRFDISIEALDGTLE